MTLSPRALTAQSSVHGVYDVLRGGTQSWEEQSPQGLRARPLSVMPPAGLVADYVAAMAPVDPAARESPAGEGRGRTRVPVGPPTWTVVRIWSSSAAGSSRPSSSA